MEKKIEIKAPIDGWVKKIIDFDENQTINGRQPLAQKLYGELYEACDKEYWSNLENNFTGTHFIIIVPDNLQLAFFLESSKIDAAKIRHNLLKERLILENTLDPNETLRSEHREYYSQFQAKSQATSHPGDSNKKLRNGLKTHGYKTAKLDKTIFNERRKFHVKTSLQVEIEMGMNDINVAETSLKLLEANIALGNIGIPFDFKVSEIKVFQNQYVTKGDTLAIITKV